MQVEKTNNINMKQFLADLNKPRDKGLEVGLTQRLHDGQIEAIKPLFMSDISILFLACARKFGKTELAIYVAWRYCAANPGAVVYLVGSEQEHLHKIYWHKKRLSHFLNEDSEKYVKHIDKRAKTVTFFNDSMIVCIGSENWKAGQGLDPDLIIYDEFKAFHPLFHTEMAPNIAANGARMLIIGTQPKVGDRNKEEYESILNDIKKNPDEGSYSEYTTFDNPITNLPRIKKGIDREIRQLREAGKEDVVQREYYSKIVPGGSQAIFPMFSREKHIKSHDFIMAHIRNYEKQFDFYNIIDPAGRGIFGGIFAAIHRKTKTIFILDEIYEKDRILSATSNMIPHIKTKMIDLNPNLKPANWYKLCDEHETLYIGEIYANFSDMIYGVASKYANKKENGISIMRDALLMEKMIFSDRCVHGIKEAEDYAYNDRGEIPKNHRVRDHIIDCIRYMIAGAGYTVAQIVEAKKKAPENWDWVKKGFSSFGPEDYIEDDWVQTRRKSQFDTF